MGSRGHEAMRDLVRTRLDAVRALRRARQQLSGFLLRQGCHYGRLAWTKLMRGMALVNAATLIAELGDLSRFVNPRQLMAWPISDWCPRSIRAVPASNAAASPRPATAPLVGC